MASRVRARDNEVTIRWAPANHNVSGNERADELAKAAADGSCPDDAVPGEYRWGASISHVTRVATEARSRTAAEWMRDRFGNPARKYRPPPGKGMRRAEVSREQILPAPDRPRGGRPLSHEQDPQGDGR